MVKRLKRPPWPDLSKWQGDVRLPPVPTDRAERPFQSDGSWKAVVVSRMVAGGQEFTTEVTEEGLSLASEAHAFSSPSPQPLTSELQGFTSRHIARRGRS